MAGTTNILLVAGDGISTLAIDVDEVTETVYSFADGEVTLSARANDTTIDYATLKDITRGIAEWWLLVQKYLSVNGLNIAPDYAREIENKADEAEIKLKFGSVEAIKATLNKDSEQITFASRDALVLSPRQFQMFLNTLGVVLSTTQSLLAN